MTDIPDKLKGKELEELVLFRARADEERGLYTLGRYGVQGVMMRGDSRSGEWGGIANHPDIPQGAAQSAATGKGQGPPSWRPIRSYPDMEGVTPGGRQFVCELKVESGSGFNMSNVTHFSERQLAHLLRRDRFGVTAFILLHFNARHMKTIEQEAVTWAIPVSERLSFWQEFARMEIKTLSRSGAELVGVRVPWNLHSERAKRHTPDLLFAINELRAYAGISG